MDRQGCVLTQPVATKIQWNLSNMDTNRVLNKLSLVLISEVQMDTRVVLVVGKGVLFREVSSIIQECPYREVPLYYLVSYFQGSVIYCVCKCAILNCRVLLAKCLVPCN